MLAQVEEQVMAQAEETDQLDQMVLEVQMLEAVFTEVVLQAEIIQVL